MVSCPRCGGESPADSKHCVQCGHPMDADGAARTSFGMPKVNAQGPNAAAGAATTRFGAEDLARLAAAAAEANLSDAAPAPVEVAPVPSLLAGLPRPRVSSAPSPLTSGRFNPGNPQGIPPPSGLGALPPLGGAPQPAPMSASRNTVMGMPVLGGLGVPASAESEAPAATGRRAGIASLDSFDVSAPAPAPAPVAGPIPSAPAAPAGGGLSLGKPAERAAAPSTPAAVEPSTPAAPAPSAAPAGGGLSLGKPSDVAPDAAPAPPAPAPNAPNAPKPTPAAASGGGTKWVLVVLVLAAAGAAAWYFFGRG